MKYLLSVDLKASNATIGGIPSFPYGWCLLNFLGKYYDLVSWDYGMNKGNGYQGLEVYAFHAMTSMSKSPMIMVLDNKGMTMDLLQRYVQGGSLEDLFTVKRGKGFISLTLILFPKEENPEGLRGWYFGVAPLGILGQSSWHIRLKENEKIVWIVNMKLLRAVEQAGGVY